MKAILVAALAAAAALGAAGCRSSGGTGSAASAGPDAVGMRIRNYQVIWTRGGKLGYLKSYDVAKPAESSVIIHYVTDLDFRDRGWIANDGQAERFEYSDPAHREALRSAFERVPLPVDTIENQIKRIFMVDPGLEIALRPADPVDVQK